MPGAFPPAHPRISATETEITDSLMEGQKGTLFVEKTPFYATMGGQVGDTGVIETANGRFVVEDTIKLRGGKFGQNSRKPY